MGRFAVGVAVGGALSLGGLLGVIGGLLGFLYREEDLDVDYDELLESP